MLYSSFIISTEYYSIVSINHNLFIHLLKHILVTSNLTITNEAAINIHICIVWIEVFNSFGTPGWFAEEHCKLFLCGIMELVILRVDL